MGNGALGMGMGMVCPPMGVDPGRAREDRWLTRQGDLPGLQSCGDAGYLSAQEVPPTSLSRRPGRSSRPRHHPRCGRRGSMRWGVNIIVGVLSWFVTCDEILAAEAGRQFVIKDPVQSTTVIPGGGRVQRARHTGGTTSNGGGPGIDVDASTRTRAVNSAGATYRRPVGLETRWKTTTGGNDQWPLCPDE